MACINYPLERWVLYRLAPDPALLLSHSQRKRMDGEEQERRGREMGDEERRERERETERGRGRESDPVLP